MKKRRTPQLKNWITSHLKSQRLFQLEERRIFRWRTREYLSWRTTEYLNWGNRGVPGTKSQCLPTLPEGPCKRPIKIFYCYGSTGRILDGDLIDNFLVIHMKSIKKKKCTIPKTTQLPNSFEIEVLQ